MERREADEIAAFLSLVGQATLLEYYGLLPSSSDEAREAAIKKRRQWAQGQQANPKYRAEAMFLIKSNSLLRRVLIDEREQVDEQETAEAVAELEAKLKSLSEFIVNALQGEVLSPTAEAAAKAFGGSLGLSEPTVDDRVNEVLSTRGARRGQVSAASSASAAAPVELPSQAAMVDYYEVLRAVPGASTTDLEAAYRARYRWARNLKDLKRSSEFLAQLDEAWRVLKDPSKREAYDTLRLNVADETDEVTRAARARRAAEGGPTTLPPFRNEGSSFGGPRSEPPRPSPASEAPRTATGWTDPPRPSPVTDRAPVSEPPRPSPARPSTEPPRPVASARTDAELPKIGRARTEPPRPAPASDPGSESGDSPPPPNISGRTLGIADGPQTVRERAPRLHVAGEATVRLTVSGTRPVEHRMLVQNHGQGRMFGRVTSDVSWLVPRIVSLDPAARDQYVAIQVDPVKVPRAGASGQITVVADHGERKTVTFEVRYENRTPLFVGLGLTTLLVAAAAVWAATRTPETPAPAPGPTAAPVAAPSTTTIKLTIDPVADAVLVDGKVVGHGSVVELPAPAPGQKAELEIRADGFATVTQTLVGGETAVDKTISLALTDKMDWRPPEGAKLATVPDATSVEILALGPTLDKCFTGAGGSAIFRVYFDENGALHGLDIADAAFEVGPVNECFRRAFRGLRVTHKPPGLSMVEVPMTVGRK